MQEIFYLSDKALQKNDIVYHMKEKDLLKKAQAAAYEGVAIEISENERHLAKSLVESEKCFWSLGYDRIMAYEQSDAD